MQIREDINYTSTLSEYSLRTLLTYNIQRLKLWTSHLILALISGQTKASSHPQLSKCIRYVPLLCRQLELWRINL